MNLIEIGRMTEEEARSYLESIRWPNGLECPHCGRPDCTRLQGEKHRPGTIQCNHKDCRKQFTVTVGSVMESSHVSLVKWAMAFHLICSSKKGFSAKQLQRELELGSYRTAWFMLHRIRHAMSGETAQQPMDGEVEVDETYVGGKPRHKGKSPRGRASPKAPVLALVQREGTVRCLPVKNVDSKMLHGEVLSNIDRTATVYTDQLPLYKGIGTEFDGGHHSVNHGRKQYVRRGKDGKKIHTNTVESFFALIKRGHYGVYHQMSKVHLHRYCDEFAFRWHYRKVSDAVRTDAAIQAAEGKRLMYETSAAKT